MYKVHSNKNDLKLDIILQWVSRGSGVYLSLNGGGIRVEKVPLCVQCGDEPSTS